MRPVAKERGLFPSGTAPATLLGLALGTASRILQLTRVRWFGIGIGIAGPSDKDGIERRPGQKCAIRALVVFFGEAPISWRLRLC